MCINNEGIKHIESNIYLFFSDNITDITENFIIEKHEIKEKESLSYEQKLKDVKLYVKHMSLGAAPLGVAGNARVCWH